MSDQPPRRRKDPRQPHWYNPAVQLDDSQPLAPRRSKARERSRRRREEKTLPAPKWTWGVFALVGIGIVGVISLIMVVASGAQTSAMPTATRPPLQPSQSAAPSFNIRAWDGQQRYTVLIMGLDKRPGEEGAGSRTDTMMLVSIDPATKSIGMLSIPRDLYVPIPGQSDMQRINAAYALGELDQPGKGPKLVMQTIQYNFGISVNSYVLVSFDAVIGVVDAIGGIDVDVPKAIDDPEYPDMNYGFDPLYIPAGRIHMDGQLALKYARTRHQDSDYDRTYRQQQVMLAIRQKILKPDMLPKVIGQAPTLWNQLSKGVITDFTLDQLLSMGWYVKDIPPANIKRGTIQDKYAQAVQYQGETVVTPNRALIGELMTEVFGANYSH